MSIKPIHFLASFRKIIRRFWPDIYKERFLIFGAVAALIAEILLRLLEPWPLKFIIDHVLHKSFSSARLPWGHEWISRFDATHLLSAAAFAVVAVVGLRSLATYYNTMGFALAGNRVLTKVRTRLYEHIQCLPLAFHSSARSGDLLMRVLGDVSMLQEVLVGAALPLLANLFILLSMVVVMAWLNWKLTMLILVLFPVFFIFTLNMSHKIHESARNQRKVQGDMAATAAETVQAIKTVQALSLEDAFSGQFSINSDKDLKESVRTKRLSAKLERTVDLLVALATAVILFYGSKLVLGGTLSVGDMIVFLAYLKNALKPLADFAKYTGRLAKASAACERVTEILEIIPEVRNLPDALPAPRFEGGVEFRDVHFSYVRNQEVLRSVSFIVKPRQHIGIVALSGAGKSTLVSLILRLTDPGQGQVLIDGTDIRRYTLESLRGQISTVLQDTVLFSASIRDNITCGLRGLSAREVQEAAAVANIHDFIMTLEDGYDTLVGERGATLSGGQRQRVAIARAVIRKSPIIILDEPTTGLDRENELEIQKAVHNLHHKSTIFTITHKLTLVSGADCILYIDQGTILERGTHQELIRQNDKYAGLYKMQTENALVAPQ